MHSTKGFFSSYVHLKGFLIRDLNSDDIKLVNVTENSCFFSIQAVFLRTFPAIYSELLKFFTVREVAGFVRETLGSLPNVVQADSPLEPVKLQCISKTVESQLYINPGKANYMNALKS